MSSLSLRSADVHHVTVDGRRMLFHVPTTSLFEMDEVSGAVLDLFGAGQDVTPDSVERAFDGRFAPDQVADAIADFVSLDILRGPDGKAPEAAIRIERFPLSTMVLNVNTGCNLSCTYCYKEDLATPDKGDKMSFETAARSFELLLEQAGERDRVNLVFFGGEPLSNLPLIRQVVAYAERRAGEAGKTVDFSLTTNATLLTEPVVDFLDAHRFGLSISMDGPAPLHDLRRRTVGGKGTYDVVARKVRMLLSRYRSRPVGARVTLTAGVTDVIGIHQHLKNDLGFFEVGFAPVTSGDISLFNLNAEELAEVFAGMKTLGEAYTEAALRDQNIGFSNMHQLMTDLAEGTHKSLPCGAGVGLLAVDHQGELNLCHRFTGSSLPTFGNVRDGIDQPALSAFLESALDKSDRSCATCRVRSVCAGGCYHESYARYADPLNPVWHYCELMRDWVDFGIVQYTRILNGNPAFFAQHVEPRRATR